MRAHRLAFGVLIVLGSACSTGNAAARPPSPSPSAPAAAVISPSPDQPPNLFAVGIDWQQTVLVDAPTGAHGGRARQSPDGSRFFTGSSVVTVEPSATGSTVHDAGGVSPTGKVGWIWADDSRHLCAAYDPTFSSGDSSTAVPTNLYIELPGSPPEMVAQAGSSFGQSAAVALGCSFTHGTATVGEECVSRLCEAWTIDLLTHATTSHLVIPDGAGSVGVSSADDTLLAVSGADATSPGVWTTADGSRVATLPAATLLVAFTGDDSAALVVAGNAVQLIDWRRGTVLATLPGKAVQGVLVEPGGKRLAVALGSPFADASGYPPPADVVVVGTDGKMALLGEGLLPEF